MKPIIGTPTIPPTADSALADSLVARFLDKVRPGESCWSFKAGHNGVGYPVIAISRTGVKILAHRLAYELWVGPIPDGFVIDHLCRNPGCINPDHLEAVTHRENTLRGESPMAKQARQTECHHGHPYSEKNTYRRKGHRQCRACHRNRERQKYRQARGMDPSPADCQCGLTW